MAVEQVLEIPIRRHIIESEQTFESVMDGIAREGVSSRFETMAQIAESWSG